LGDARDPRHARRIAHQCRLPGHRHERAGDPRPLHRRRNRGRILHARPCALSLPRLHRRPSRACGESHLMTRRNGPRGFLVKRREALIPAALALGFTAAAPAPIAPWATAALDYNGVFVRYGNLWFDPVPDDPDGKPIQAIRVRGPDRDNVYAGNSDNPILQPWARDIVKANADAELRREHVYTADDTCWPSGVPQAVNLLDGVQFLPAKDHIVIIYQRNHQVRWIWMNQPHSRNVKPSWYGESVGHFEGTTLVVDTIGVKAH